MRVDRRKLCSLKKIKSLNGLSKLVKRLKKQGKKIVFTNGCFDILHFGHAKYLQDARNKGDILIVAVNNDSSVKKLKGKLRPIVNENNRLGLLSALECVNYLTLFNEETPLKIIKELKPDILVKGADWKKESIVGSGFVQSYGGRVFAIKLVKGLSTSKLIKKIAKTC